MCKKALLILVALMLAFAVPYSQALAEEGQANGDYYDLKAQIVDLQQQLANVNGLLKDLSYNVQENQALSEIVKEMSFQFKKSEGELHSISSLKDRIERDVIPQMISIQSTVASLGASIGEKVKALGIRVYDSESSIQQLSARTKANEDRLRQLDGIEDAVRSLNERVYTVEKALKQGAPVAGPDTGAGADVADAVAKLKDKISLLSVQVQGLKGVRDQTTALGGQVADLDAQVSALGDTLNGTAAALGTLQGRIATAEAQQANFATLDALGELQSQVSTLNGELQKANSASNTNFVVGLLGVLTGVGALGLLLLK